MKLKSGGGPTRPPMKGGTYVAVCVYSIQLGEQLHKFSDKSNYQHDVSIGFELIGFTYEDNGVQKPYDLGKTYNASIHPNSALRKMVNTWNGYEMTEEDAAKFDTNDLVGRPALLNVILKENGYNDIQSVAQLPEGLPIPTPVPTMPLIRFDLEPFDQAAFDALPEWAQNKIKKSVEWGKKLAPTETIAAVPPTLVLPNNYASPMAAQSVQVAQPAYAPLDPSEAKVVLPF